MIIGICFKLEQREALELLLRGKNVFCVLPTGSDKSLIYQIFVHVKSSSSSVQRPTVINCYLACVKKGISRKHTTFTYHAKMLLVPINWFLCRVVYYALEENILSVQVWILATYWIYMYVILRGRDMHIDFLWSTWFALWCKSIFFVGLFRNVKLFIAAD